VPVVSKPCIFAGSCPGDLGDTEVLWFGRQLCISKASKYNQGIRRLGDRIKLHKYCNYWVQETEKMLNKSILGPF
jgi:hypothetical protein